MVGAAKENPLSVLQQGCSAIRKRGEGLACATSHDKPTTVMVGKAAETVSSIASSLGVDQGFLYWALWCPVLRPGTWQDIRRKSTWVTWRVGIQDSLLRIWTPPTRSHDPPKSIDRGAGNHPGTCRFPPFPESMAFLITLALGWQSILQWSAERSTVNYRCHDHRDRSTPRAQASLAHRQMSSTLESRAVEERCA